MKYEVWRGRIESLPKPVCGEFALLDINRIIKPLARVVYTIYLALDNGEPVKCCKDCINKAKIIGTDPLVRGHLSLEPHGAMSAKLVYNCDIICNGEVKHRSTKEYKIILDIAS